jgi:hypothetical protein
MHLSEALDIQGRLTLRKTTIDHQLIEAVTANNSIVLTGRELVAKLFMKDVKETVQPVSHIAVGTGTTSVTPQNTSLSKEIFRKAIAPIDLGRDLQTIEIATPEGKSIRKKVLISTDLEPEEANGALTEAALFTASNIMYNRVTFAPVNKSADFRLTLLWEILF